MKKLSEMTDEELEQELIKKYGENWLSNKIDNHDELVKEFFYRASIAE